MKKIMFLIACLFFGSTHSLKFLVVDDTAMIRNILTNVLHSMGYYDFIEAVDGQDAFSKYYSYKPDVIITDFNMPRMNGIQLTYEIRKSDHSTKIIMITGENDQRIISDAMRAGVNQYLTKPVHPEQLRDAIRRVLLGRSIDIDDTDDNNQNEFN